MAHRKLDPEPRGVDGIGWRPAGLKCEAGSRTGRLASVDSAAGGVVGLRSLLRARAREIGTPSCLVASLSVLFPPVSAW